MSLKSGLSMIGSGKVVILAILLMAVGLSLVSVSYHRHTGRRSYAFWGNEAALLISRAPRVEALELADDAADPADGAVLRHAGRSLRVVRRTEITTSRGIAHMRAAIVDDASFDWERPPGDCRPVWQYALQFSDGTSTTTLLVALNCQRLALLDRGTSVSVAPVAVGFEDFLAEQFPPREPAPTSAD